jgi:hypothetical protein
MDSIKIYLKKSSGEVIGFENIPKEYYEQVLEMLRQTLLPSNTSIATKQLTLAKIGLNQENITVANVPSKSEIKAFIRLQKDYQHNLKLISKHFFGFPFENEVGNTRIVRIYDRLWTRTMEVRKEIKKEENDGDWVKEMQKGFGKIATFKYVRRH